MSQRNALLAAILLTLVFATGAIALQAMVNDPEPDAAVVAPQVTTMGPTGGHDAWDDDGEWDDEDRQSLSTSFDDDDDEHDEYDDEDDDDHDD